MPAAPPEPEIIPKTAPRRRKRVREAVWTPLTGGLVVLILGAISLAAGKPLLFPSLAPATVTHVNTPHLKTARAWNTVAGQLIGIGAAYLAVWLTGAAGTPAALSAGFLPPARMWASVLGVLIGLLAQVGADAVNPAAASTLLIVTFGGFKPTAGDFWTLVGGVALMSALGEAARRLRLARAEEPTR